MDFEHEQSLASLETYINESIGTRTTRHASEEELRCPILPAAIAAERQMRITLHRMYDQQVEFEEVITAEDIDDLKKDYWSRAQQADESHGAIPTHTLEDYFHVGQDRSYEALREAAYESSNGTDTLEIKLFEAVDAYIDILDLDSVTASRYVMVLLKKALPRLRDDYYELVSSDKVEAEVAKKIVFQVFFDEIIPQHLTLLYGLHSEGNDIHTMAGKSHAYPLLRDGKYPNAQLRISRQDAKAISDFRKLQERPYTDRQLALAEKLVQEPAMQRSLIRFHNSLIEDAEAYLAAEPERINFSLEPFSEIFLPLRDGDEVKLIPNPKLLKVIANNTMPAVAAVILRNAIKIEDLGGSFLQEGIILAKKLRTFQTEIGQFSDYDFDTDTVSFDSVFSRTCPAMQMFTEALVKRLPVIYEACR